DARRTDAGTRPAPGTGRKSRQVPDQPANTTPARATASSRRPSSHLTSLDGKCGKDGTDFSGGAEIYPWALRDSHEIRLECTFRGSGAFPAGGKTSAADSPRR